MKSSYRRTVAAVTIAAAMLSAAAPAWARPLQELLDGYLEKHDLPGGVLLVSGPDGRELAVAGIANRRTKAPVTPQTRFYAASVGKMATAVAVLQQVEEGKVGLDDTAAGLAAALPGIDRLANAKSAKLRHLLAHTSGIPDYLTDDYDEAASRDRKQRWTEAAALKFALGEKATGKPGKQYEYCNTNYVLLGAIAAAADGETFDTVLQRRVLDRAGMTRTTVGAIEGEIDLAHGYADVNDDGKLKDVSLLSWNFAMGDGPLVTTAEDLERFLFALFRDGKLLKPQSLALMRSATEHEEGYGMGAEIGSDWGGWIGHTGSYDGFEAEVRYYPERRTAILYLANGNADTEKSLLDRVASITFKGSGRARGR